MKILHEEIYQGWKIQIKNDIDENQLYKILGVEESGKHHNLYGKQGFESTDQALTKAKEYINMYSDRLEKYLQNRINNTTMRAQPKDICSVRV